MKINGNNKKATVLTFNLKSMDTRMKLCAPSRLLPPHDDLNNLNEATITFDDWCEIEALIDALQRFSDENKRCAGYWEQQTIHTPYTPNDWRTSWRNRGVYNGNCRIGKRSHYCYSSS